MIEHIFRNINDIRVFDLMTEFIPKDEKVVNDHEAVDIDEIMNLLEYNEYKHIEIEDSVEHLVRQQILGIKKVEVEGTNGCKICRYMEKLKLPKFGEHLTHVSEHKNKGTIDNYYMKDNPITESLRHAIYSHVFIVEGLEEYLKDEFNNSLKDQK